MEHFFKRISKNIMNPLAIFLITLSFIYPCTIGVARDNDGDVFLWKNRDNSILDGEIINDLIHIDNSLNNSLHSYICVMTRNQGDIEKTYMGLNENGFGIVNSVVLNNSNANSDQLRLIDDEYQLFNRALESCSTIDEFVALLGEISSDRAIIVSNFGIIDSTGNGSIFEINNNVSDIEIERIDLDDNTDFLLRTNHFRVISNPVTENLDLLDTIQRSDTLKQQLDNESLLNNILRYYASEDSFESYNGTGIIAKLISTADSNNIGLLRSMNRSNLQNLSTDFYNYPYFKQGTYNNPSGYIFSKYSVARAKTVSSVIIKSIKDNPDNSFMLTALGSPLITPYIPFKVNDDYSAGNLSSLNEIAIKSKELRELIFDFDKNEIYVDHPYKRYVDSQHLLPSQASNIYPNPNHQGFLNYLNDIESEYFDFDIDDITIGASLGNIISNVLDNYFILHLEGFNTGNYDNPRYRIGYKEKTLADDCSYAGKRIVDGTFHRNHNAVNKWVIENSDSLELTFTYSDEDFINPQILKSDWHDSLTMLVNDGDVNVNLYDISSTSAIPLVNRTMYVGCTNSYYNFNDIANVDNESCDNGDLVNDGLINIVDIVQLVYHVLEMDSNVECNLDINGDNLINIIDITLLVEIIIS